MGLTHGDHDGHRNEATGAPVQTRDEGPDIRKDLVDRVGSVGAPKVFEPAEALSFAAAWSPIISRTTLIPASLFVMIHSSREAQATSPPPRLHERVEASALGKSDPGACRCFLVPKA